MWYLMSVHGGWLGSTVGTVFWKASGKLLEGFCGQAGDECSIGRDDDRLPRCSCMTNNVTFPCAPVMTM